MKMSYIQISISFICLFFFVNSFFVIKKVFADACPTITRSSSIYQINRSSTQATLYFTPVNDQIKSYTIIYGLKPGDERYSVTFNYGVSSGAISYIVNSLDPKLNYYFKIRANNSCSSGPWSDWTADNFPQSTSLSTSKLPVTGSNIAFNVALISSIAVFAGLTIFSLAIWL